MFRKTKPNEPFISTWLADYIQAVPTMLIKLFGEPQEGDEYKVSGEYEFTDGKGHRFTIYDWKCTSLYDEGFPYPSVFWKSEEPQVFNIGSNAEKPVVEKFKEWLLEQFKRLDAPKAKKLAAPH